MAVTESPASSESSPVAVLLGIFSAALVLYGPVCHAFDSSPQPLAEAVAALEEGVPQVAIVKLQQEIAIPGRLDDAARKLAKTRLAEALLAAGRAEDAAQQARDPEFNNLLLLARIEAANGRWKEALATCKSAAAKDPESLLLCAECLWQLGRQSEAIVLLEAVGAGSSAGMRLRLAEFYLDSERLDQAGPCIKAIHISTPAEEKWKQYLEARLDLAQGQDARALACLEQLQRDSREVSENLIAGVALAMTEARTRLSGPTAADDILELFIWKYPENSHLGVIFRKLDETYAGEENPSRAELEQWSQREPPRRAAFARYYLAKALLAAGKEDRALAKVEGFEQSFPKHPILADALCIKGRILAGRGKFSAAQSAFEAGMRAAANDETRARIERTAATAHYLAGEFVLAATGFRNAADKASPMLWQHCTVNSALSWLRQGNYTRFLDDYRSLSERFPKTPLGSELIFREGLFQASRGDSRAEVTLERFSKNFTGSPRLPEAKLALAELRFAKNDSMGALDYLQAARNAAPDPETAEQAEYLALFVADAAPNRDDEKVISLCQKFLTRRRHSPHLPEVRMKLGQVFFRREDYAGAQTQFETLVSETPGAPLAESALFLAGQCSMKSMSSGGIDRAIELFEEVTKRNGTLKLHARLQQALAQNRLGKAAEAVILYDSILGTAAPAEIKNAALAGKADNLAEMGGKDRAMYAQAVAVYDQLASAPDASLVARNRARYQKGRCLEALSRPEDALAAYYDVLQAGVKNPDEYFWFYKAGFDAGRLCEAQEQWKSAIGIYQKVAALDGPRADEAKARMTQVRLEHFVWE